MISHKAELEKHAIKDFINELDSKILKRPANGESNKYMGIKDSIALMGISEKSLKIW